MYVEGRGRAEDGSDKLVGGGGGGGALVTEGDSVWGPVSGIAKLELITPTPQPVTRMRHARGDAPNWT